jgi:PAS domain S-box-containing protein
MSSKTAGQTAALPMAQRLQLLIEAVSDYAICMLDREGHVVSWNTGAQQIKGYSADEIVGQHFSRFFTPDDQAKQVPERNLREAEATGRCASEGWRVRKSGERFWALAVLQPIRDHAGHLIGFAKITRDLTERMATQERLLESERRFRLLVEGVIDYAIYMLDPSGIITNWNAGAQRLKGYSADEIIGQHFARFFSREERAAGLPYRILDIAAREGRHEAEGWRYRKDGSRFWASAIIDAIRDETGKLIGFAKVTRDITERRAAQEALRESERQFRLLVAGVTDYALFMLALNGIVTNWNAGAERIKGYKADEIIGHHFSRFYTETDRMAGLPARALQTAMTEGRFEAEGWRVRKDGSPFWANVIIDKIRDENGTLIGFAKITRDITERRKAQIALQEAQHQRAQAQKMEALGQLTGGVAHDFNNLLMVVSGYARILRRLVGDDAKGLRAIEAIELAAQQGQSLTRQLLSFARRQPVNPRVVALGERIEAVRAMLASSISASASVVIDVPADIWSVRVDVSELELALLNIALNSRDAMPQGGVITITAENVRLRREDTPHGLAGEFVALSISDTGLGIAPDVLPKVFEPFFTTKGSSKGSGLGLAQVHGFAHQSGGTVTAQSTLGKGTTVTLYLPRSTAEPEQASTDEGVELLGSGLALLVEDNPDVAEVSAEMLRQLGYRVQIEADARGALDALNEREVDLVVSDIVMPGDMNGLTLAQTIRERSPRMPIVLVTGYSSAAIGETSFTVLRKPYQIADLSRAVAGAKSHPRSSNLVHLRDVRRSPKP